MHSTPTARGRHALRWVLGMTYMRPSEGLLDAVYTVFNIGGGLLRELRVAFELGRLQVAFLEPESRQYGAAVLP